MNPIEQAFVWLNDPLNWTNPDGILVRLGEHLAMSAAALALACALGLPLGLWLGHQRRGGALVVVLSNITLAVPTLALLTILPLTPIGFGVPAVVLALTVFGVPPVLANAYVGVREADADARDAAYGMGLSGRQVFRTVELPLAVPYVVAGIRTSALQIIATAALAALVGGGGLGQIISAGFGLTIAAGAGQILAGGLLIAALALLVEGLLALVQRAVTPRALRRGAAAVGAAR